MNSNLTICWEIGWPESSAHEEPSYEYEPGSAMGFSVNTFQVSGPASHETTLQNRLFCDLFFLSLTFSNGVWARQREGQNYQRATHGCLVSMATQLGHSFFSLLLLLRWLDVASCFILAHEAARELFCFNMDLFCCGIPPLFPSVATHIYKTPSIGHE